MASGITRCWAALRLPAHMAAALCPYTARLSLRAARIDGLKEALASGPWVGADQGGEVRDLGDRGLGSPIGVCSRAGGRTGSGCRQGRRSSAAEHRLGRGKGSAASCQWAESRVRPRTASLRTISDPPPDERFSVDVKGGAVCHGAPKAAVQACRVAASGLVWPGKPKQWRFQERHDAFMMKQAGDVTARPAHLK